MSVMRGREVRVDGSTGCCVVRRDHDGVYRWGPLCSHPLEARDEVLEAAQEELRDARARVLELEAVVAGLSAQATWDPEMWEFVEPDGERVEVDGEHEPYFMARSPDGGLVCWQKDQVERDRCVPVGSSPPRMWRPKEAK